MCEPFRWSPASAKHAQLQQCDGQCHGGCFYCLSLGHPAIGTASELARRNCCIMHEPLVHQARQNQRASEFAGVGVSARPVRGGSGRLCPPTCVRYCSAATEARLYCCCLCAASVARFNCTSVASVVLCKRDLTANASFAAVILLRRDSTGTACSAASAAQLQERGDLRTLLHAWGRSSSRGCGASSMTQRRRCRGKGLRRCPCCPFPCC